VEEPGQGVRALIDGVEARLGSAVFCDLTHTPLIPAPAFAGAGSSGKPVLGPASAGTSGIENDSRHSTICFRHGERFSVIAISQTLRPDAVNVVKALARFGLDLRILSGDRDEAVEPIASALGIAYWQGGLKPADKIALIEALKANGRRVLMVGDGLNDAPSLAAAHVSLSPISAADVTQAQADAVFLGERLKPVLDAVTISRRARGLMTENLWLAAIYNAIAVPIAIAGAVTPLIAALAMSGSSLLVTLNALRVGRRKS
jgi:Cu2+-exporting ATPase